MTQTTALHSIGFSADAYDAFVMGLFNFLRDSSDYGWTADVEVEEDYEVEVLRVEMMRVEMNVNASCDILHAWTLTDSGDRVDQIEIPVENLRRIVIL